MPLGPINEVPTRLIQGASHKPLSYSSPGSHSAWLGNSFSMLLATFSRGVMKVTPPKLPDARSTAKRIAIQSARPPASPAAGRMTCCNQRGVHEHPESGLSL